MSDATIQELREVLRAHGRLSTDVDALTPEADLYDAGMTSHASVNVMLAVEEAFDVEFPDSMLKRSVFESMDAMAQAVEQLRREAA
jgi:acyl carrier protein